MSKRTTIVLSEDEYAFLNQLIARLILSTNTRHTISSLISLIIKSLKYIFKDTEEWPEDVKQFFATLKTMS